MHRNLHDRRLIRLSELNASQDYIYDLLDDSPISSSSNIIDKGERKTVLF